MTSTKQRQSKETRFWTPLRLALTLVVLSLIAALGISSCTSNDEKGVVGKSEPAPPAKSAPAPIKSAPAPPAALASLPANIRDAGLRTINGQTLKLSDYAGKVVLVNLWATWCGPCRNETPELVKLHKEFQSRGVEMVGLTNDGDPRETPESVKSFVREFQVDYHIGWASPEVQIAFMQMTGRDAIPQSFIISRDGHVLKKFVGFNPISTPPQIRQALEDALNGRG
jgi:thiol-disulfide isomerase/thioredoxin